MLLGRTREELGGSEYLAVVHGLVRGTPPWIDLEAEKRLHRVVLRGGARAACCARRTTSARAASRWRSRSAASAARGSAPASRSRAACGADALLFGESQSRMLLSLRRRNLSRLRDLARRDDVPLHGARRGARAQPRDRRPRRPPGRGRRASAGGGRSSDASAAEAVAVYSPGAASRLDCGRGADDGQVPRGVRRRRRLRPPRGGEPRLPRRSTRCSTAGRSRRASSRRTARCSSRTAAWGSSPTSSRRTSCARLEGRLAIGHNRYSTARLDGAQELPAVRRRVGAGRARDRAQRQPGERRRAARAARGARLDLPVDRRHRGDRPPDRRARAATTLVDRDRRRAGARCAARTRWSSSPRTQLIAVRDPDGFRPLVLGRVEDAVVVASETCALDLDRRRRTSARSSRARSSCIDERGVRVAAARSRPRRRHHCVFEYVYFARPDSRVFGRNVYEVRKELGRQLAREQPVAGRHRHPGARLRRAGGASATPRRRASRSRWA